MGGGQWSLVTDLVGDDVGQWLALASVVTAIVGRVLWMRRR